jgi:hypothetical protein
MNKLVEQAIKAFKEGKDEELRKEHEKAKNRLIECFGDYSIGNISETEKPCCFRIKDTNWDLYYGVIGNSFTLWHKDRNSSRTSSDNRFNAWAIVDMKTLGESLSSVSKTWGL